MPVARPHLTRGERREVRRRRTVSPASATLGGQVARTTTLRAYRGSAKKLTARRAR